MKALRCTRYGPPETLEVQDLPALTPRPDEAVIRVEAAAVNFPDSLVIQNKYQKQPPLPFTPGSEVAGTITAVGEQVTGHRVGDAVMTLCGLGGFAEEVAVPHEKLVRVPQGMPMDEAAAFLMTYGTMYHALADRGQLREGETVLVLGAGGGIGLASIQLAKALGGRVIAAASSAEKLEARRRMGADAVINYETENLRERLKELTAGAGVDVVCDPVGDRYAEPALRSMAWRGRFLVIGFAGGEIPKIALNLPLLKGCSIVGVLWGAHMRKDPQANAADMKSLAALYQRGLLRPMISARYPLDQAARAIQDVMNRKARGKVVVLP